MKVISLLCYSLCQVHSDDQLLSRLFPVLIRARQVFYINMVDLKSAD